MRSIYLICVILAQAVVVFADDTPTPPIPIPVYERGAIPNWFLPQEARQNGLTFLGAHERLRVAMDKVRAWGRQHDNTTAAAAACKRWVRHSEACKLQALLPCAHGWPHPTFHLATTMHFHDCTRCSCRWCDRASRARHLYPSLVLGSGHPPLPPPPIPFQLVRGVPTLVSVAGGSNTVGSGAHNGYPWPRYLSHWLKDAFPHTNVSVGAPWRY